MTEHVSSTQQIPASAHQQPGLRHVAIIMDGNGRWANARMLPRTAGHLKGVDAVRDTVKACIERNIAYLTLFAFSSENWRRPAEEVSILMGIFINALEREVTKLHANGVRLRVIGDLTRFEPKLQAAIERAHLATDANSKLTLTVCANYGGRWDIMNATRAALKVNPQLQATPELLTEDHITPHLSMAYAPEPDLFIRTGGEKRVSNYLLWQLAYTELYFTDQYWPEFDAHSLDLAIESYLQRERRFGRTSAQVSAELAKNVA